ncbi:DUF305 domain-containing protein [Prauserella cavernicola]|uniref:DUF305 domain-containing protein n=1 Tax=Prauserella cavernicola TaxID=2800127 RepID=A0A934QU53_9PSEU|nr:DUF305 domain-containing protein [Prauserella cavernicola]MBK1786363.1 DUF305 domain-containing protein [Prauserella cavernicola]
MGRRLAAGVAVVFFALAGCTAEEAPPEQSAPDVIMPDKPGEQAKVVPGDEAAEHRQEPKPNDADVRYMTNMIPHHQQAIVMTDLAEQHATGEQVKAIAGRIAASQEAEISVMETWLEDFDAASPHDGHGDHGEHGGGHDHAQMPGMATQQQLDALGAARGAEFDRQFLQLMITHHEGALTMAEEQLGGGIEPRAIAMAQDIITGQTDEIEHMRGMGDA